MSTLLSKKTDYALLIMSHLYERQNGGSAREISDRYGLSKAFMANILKELCQKGFIVSHRGAKGGYSLQRPANQINLAELLENLEDGMRLTNCTSHTGHTGDDHDCSIINMCPIRRPINEIHERILGVMRSVTLADLVKSPSQDGTTYQPTIHLLNRPIPETTANAKANDSERMAEPELQEQFA
jgi:Rrf2 family transcriptional regulator, cysteine metabolism repressor